MADKAQVVGVPAAAFAPWLREFVPAPVAVNARERLRVALGAALGIFLTAWLCRWWAGAAAAAPWSWLMAPMGASAVLVFGMPSSPLAQPWAVIAGHAVSALAGVLCVHWLGSALWVAGVAVGLAITLMFALRCLHPPGGASALLPVLFAHADPSFVLFPVLANAVVLVLVGMAYNPLTRHAYPHRQGRAAPAVANPAEEADLDAVMARYNEVLDISRDDLKALLHDTQMRAHQRELATTRCGDIMSRNPITVSRQTPLAEAWALFRTHRIKALPVVDAAGGVEGIVTTADVMRLTEDAHGFDAAAQGLRVEQVMTARVCVAGENQHLAELIPLFGRTGHHHIPIVDDASRLVGVVTSSDVVAALCPPAASAC